MQICEADDQGVQAALHQAYENNMLRGRNLLAARRLVELRQRAGKASALQGGRRKTALSPENLVRVFEEDTERKRLIVKRTQATRNRLVFITEALRQLSKDESFMAILEDEDLTTMPARIAARVAYLPKSEA